MPGFNPSITLEHLKEVNEHRYFYIRCSPFFNLQTGEAFDSFTFSDDKWGAAWLEPEVCDEWLHFINRRNKNKTCFFDRVPSPNPEMYCIRAEQRL